MKQTLIRMIRFYQRRISPLFPSMCRYQPTCSQYAVEALQEYGVLRGGWMAVCRLARCNVFFPGGYDPLPPCDHKQNR